MFVSPAQAPYAGVYQRQPTGLPSAEFIPQYPEIPSTNGCQAPQSAYQNNVFGGQIYVPQMNGQHVCFILFLYILINKFYSI